jgi:hypothetical protein
MTLTTGIQSRGDPELQGAPVATDSGTEEEVPDLLSPQVRSFRLPRRTGYCPGGRPGSKLTM